MSLEGEVRRWLSPSQIKYYQPIRPHQIQISVYEAQSTENSWLLPVAVRKQQICVTVLCVFVCMFVLEVGRSRLNVVSFNPTKVQRKSTSYPAEHKIHVSVYKTYWKCSTFLHVYLRIISAIRTQ
jgi:hypothetical protein